jgi:ABC-2 type transport system permease protein
MKGFLAFTKKEILEQFRTYKWLIFIAAFFIFGMTSPLLAKLTPEIISSMNMNGVKITIPEVNAVDAYGQFFKNLTQMGILILLLVFGGTVSNELMKGTLVNILAKGLPRHTVLLSKYTAAVLLWSVGFLISAVTCYGYTVYLFQNAAVDNLIFSFFCLWIFGLFVIALIFLSSAITTGSFGGLT